MVDQPPDAVTAEAGMDRLKLADEVHCVPISIDTAETTQAKNSIEKMLAHQLPAAHKLAMTFAGQAREQAQMVTDDIYGDSLKHVEHATKMANASARMMDAF
jgi:methyl coenzyme M reductase subunit D